MYTKSKRTQIIFLHTAIEWYLHYIILLAWKLMCINFGIVWMGDGEWETVQASSSEKHIKQEKWSSLKCSRERKYQQL